MTAAGPVSFAEAMAQVLADGGVDLGALGLAWARVAPTVALVPATMPICFSMLACAP